MHIHLDALGGISGNMFIGALLDLWPELAEQLPAQLEKAGFAELVTLAVSHKNDGVLTGTLFSVKEQPAMASAARLLNPDRQTHPHRSWRQIRELLEASRLDAPVKTHALGIFTVLAEAEASVHGKAVDAVEFHEVGAWDSIADIVCAAYLVVACGVRSWSVSSLPLGRGRIDTAHGVLPVPAPAVALLLRGWAFHDDGREGERITPTGAAILHYLKVGQEQLRPALVLQKSGQGFGSRGFPGISNVLRALFFTASVPIVSPDEDTVAILSFEVDDQNPEDLALALDLIRRHPGVLDVVQYSVSGKKQRVGSSVRVLVLPAAMVEVQNLCFTQTTTLGIRHEHSRRSVLARRQESVELDGRHYRVKLTLRPDGELTAKAELDDLAQVHLNQAERQLMREVVEAIAIERNSLPVLYADNTADKTADKETVADD